MYKLIIEDDEGKTTVVPLIRDEITIGRKEGNTIRLTERNVSRKHARLMKSNGSIYIEDLTSYNGIRVNGDRIAGRSPVNEGDRIQIGDYQLALKLDKAAQSGVPSGEAHDTKTTPFLRDNNAPGGASDMTATVQTPISSMGISGQGEAPARLVVVSSNFAGQEFILDKAAIVIGRTDENDVVVNHRSISRHHAKIVREAGHYHIVDLQSANGVRVNGEEYGKVELRKGDQIDLGHVRLRFVAPGEDFLFDRDAQIVDVGGGGGGRALWIALSILVAIGAIAVVLWMTRTPSGTATTQVESKPSVKPVSADAEAQVAKLLLDADRALKAEEWETAILKADAALKLDSTQELARDKRSKAEAEKKASTSYKNFLAFAEKNDFDSAVASYGEIADDSMYRQKGGERYATVRRSYVRTHLDQARAAARRNDCEQAHQHVEATLTVDESNPEAQEIIKSCGSKPIKLVSLPVRPKQPRDPAVAQVKPPKESPKPESSPEPENVTPNAAVDKLLQDAQDKYVHGQYASAIEDAKHAVKSQPSKAWRIIGASQCFLKNRDGALTAWNKLDAQGRQFLKYVCSRNTITVP